MHPCDASAPVGWMACPDLGSSESVTRPRVPG
jgi:hypothetical protein